MWGLYELSPHQWHIKPCDEIHICDTNLCHCEPYLEVGDDGVDIYVHNSFDGREAVEQAQKILN